MTSYKLIDNIYLSHQISFYQQKIAQISIPAFYKEPTNLELKFVFLYIWCRKVGWNWAKTPKTPITSTALICILYKLQGSFIILLGVYCEKFFWWNPVEHLFFVVERFQY